MRRFNDQWVLCPFYPEHSMPLPRLDYHYQKCEKKYLLENPGKETFHCKHHYPHVFLDKEKCTQHEAEECPIIHKELKETKDVLGKRSDMENLMIKNQKNAQAYNQLQHSKIYGD